jgi:spore germination protein KC
MEAKLADNVRSEIKAALKKGQKELKTDIFGFGFALYRKYPRLWHKEYEKKWQDLFPDVTINIDVRAKILNTGTGIKKITDK